MKNKKYITIITLISLLAVIAGAFCIYFFCSDFKINIESDKSIISNLSANEDSAVTILAKEKYKDYAAVLYTAPSDEKVHFAYFIKHRFFNRYSIKGGGSTNNGVDCTKVQNDDGELIFFIYDNASEASKCSAFELNFDGTVQSKIDEIDTPKGPYIITKEYELNDKENEVLVFEGSKTIEEINQYF